MQQDHTVTAVFNINRAMQELSLTCDMIDRTIEDLHQYKRNILHNIAVAKQNVEVLYYAQRDANKLVTEQV